MVLEELTVLPYVLKAARMRDLKPTHAQNDTFLQQGRPHLLQQDSTS